MDSFWRRVVENLKILADEKAIQHFKAKLRTEDEVNLFGYLAELHFSAFFKRKGFQVVLNPPINDRSADFMIRNNNLPMISITRSRPLELDISLLKIK